MSDSEDASDWHEWINHYVSVEDSMLGKLKYFGNTEFGEGLWCGVELVKPLGKNDGMVNNVRYFTCEPMFGLFVPSYKVVKVKNSDLEKQMFEYEHLNKTFTFNDAIQALPVHNAAIILEAKNGDNKVDSCNLDRNKLSKSRSDSEESLGILNTDLMNDLEISWDSPDSVSILPLNHSLLKEEKSPNCLLSSSKYKLPDEFCCPISASTPRHPNKKQIFKSVFEFPLALEEETAEIDVFEEQCQHTQELFFDVDKLKNTPHLSSTSKNLIDFDNYNMLENSVSLKDFEKRTKQDKESFNKNLSLQNPRFVSCQNLDVTYELSEHFSPVIQNITDANTLPAKNSFINTVNEEVGCYQNCSKLKDLPKTDIYSKGNIELNATFELKNSDKELEVKINPISILQMNKTINLSEANFSVSPFDGSFTNISSNESVLKQTFVIDSSLSDSCCILLPKNNLLEGCNDQLIENNSCVKKSQHSSEPITSPSISLESSDKCNFLPSNNCNNSNASTKKLLDSNVTLNSTFQKLNDTFLSLKSKNNDCRTYSIVENDKIKSYQGFKKPFSPTSRFKQAPRFHNSRDSKKVTEEKSLTHANFKFNKKETKFSKKVSFVSNSVATFKKENTVKLSETKSEASSNFNDSSSLSKLRGNTNFSKNDALKNTKRLSLASSSSLDSNFTKQNSVYSRRSSLSSDTTLKTNIDKQEISKCTRKVFLVSNSVATLKKKENTVKLSESKLEASSNFDNSSSLSKLKGIESSLKIPTKLNKKSQAFQSSQICQRALDIRQNKTRLSDGLNIEKSRESRFGSKLRYSLRIPKSSNNKNGIQSSQICQSAKISNASADFFVPSENHLNTTSSIIYKPEIELNECSKTNSDLLNKTLIVADVFPSTNSVLKKTIPSHEKIEKSDSTGKNKQSIPITCKNINGSDLAKEMSSGIQKLKAFSTNISSGIKIPQLKSKSNCSTACPPIGIIKPRFSMMHHLKDVNAEKLETENIQPSQNVFTSKQTLKFGSAAKSTSKQMNFTKKTVLPPKNKVGNELLECDHSTMKNRINKDLGPRRIPKCLRSSTVGK